MSLWLVRRVLSFVTLDTRRAFLDGRTNGSNNVRSTVELVQAPGYANINVARCRPHTQLRDSDTAY